MVRAVDARPGERVLDLAAGTGTSSEPFAAAGATVVPYRLLPRDAAGRQAPGARAAVRRRRRAAAALRRRRLRRGDDQLRPAQRGRHRTGALAELLRVTRPRRPAGRSASSATRPGRRSAASTTTTSCGRCPRWPGRSRPTPTPTSTWPSRSSAWPAQQRARRAGRRGGLGRGGLARPLRRDRRAAPGSQELTGTRRPGGAAVAHVPYVCRHMRPRVRDRPTCARASSVRGGLPCSPPTCPSSPSACSPPGSRWSPSWPGR